MAGLPPRTERLYLDANATETLRPAALAALIDAAGLVGNPASVHGEGRRARHLLESARARLAARFGADPANVVLLSGATEANAAAIHGLRGDRPVLIGATEHDAVRAAAPDADVIPVRRDGTVDPAALDDLLAAHPGALVCLMAANNETGVLHPLAEIGATCARRGAMLHVDAVQAAGRLDLDPLALGAASVAISSHKLGGPAGAGALLLSAEAAARFRPLIRGGGQERGRRGGTPPLAAIAGFAAAAEAADPAAMPRLAALRDAIEEGACETGAIVMGASGRGGGAARLANTVSLALPGVSAERQVIALDLAGIAVSAGAACSSGKVARSHVLAAMGAGDLAECAIRVSLPWNAPDDCAGRFLDAYRAMAARMLRRGRAASIAVPAAAGA